MHGFITALLSALPELSKVGKIIAQNLQKAMILHTFKVQVCRTWVCRLEAPAFGLSGHVNPMRPKPSKGQV